MTVQQEFQVVILAGGKGSRMPEITAGKPKCLLPIGGKPMVWYPLNKLQQSGFNDVILIGSTSHMSEITLFLEQTDLDIRIDPVYIPDNDEMGTADSLRFINDKIKTDVIVISCDLITDVDLGQVINLFRKHDASLCSLLFTPQSQQQVVVPGPKTKHKPERDLIGIDSETKRLVFLASASDFESDVSLSKALIRKHNITMYSNLVDSHLYIMKNWVVKYLQHESSISTLKGEFLPHLIKKQMARPAKKQEANPSIIEVKDGDDIFNFVKENDLSTVHEAGSFMDHEGDMKPCYHGDSIRCYAYVAKPACLGVRVNTMPAYWSINGKIMELWDRLVNKPLELISPKAEIQSNQVDKCLVWDSCKLREKTSFKNSVIASNTVVNSFSRVFNSIVMNGVTVNEKVALENCIVCNQAVIESNCQLKNCIIGSNHVVASGSVCENEVLTDSDRLMEFDC